MSDALPQHAIYAEPLASLAEPAALLAALADWSGRTGWQRIYGRFLPRFSAAGSAAGAVSPDVPDAPPRPATSRGDEPWALLVFEHSGDEQAFAVVELWRDPCRDRRRGQTAWYPVASLGWAALTAFPDDDRLPTLRSALAVPGELTVVRYRPGRRCTFRVRDHAGTRFGKVFGDDSGRAIHEAGVALAACGDAGVLGFAVAPPMAWDGEHRVLWQGLVAGAPLLAHLSTPAAASLAQRMGSALGSLAVAPVTVEAVFDSTVQCARTLAYARELGARVPALVGEATALGEGLVALHRQRPGRVCPIHGAPHVNQWLLDDDRLALVDFDRFAAGNPELDVATFLGELDFEEELATPVAIIADAFVAGYEAVAGALDPDLLRGYRAHKRLAKALRSARSLRVDGARRAARHLATATAALHGEVAA